ncbi:MAG: hypothetical protein ACJ0Q6_02140 [Candidatus Azotimanducaceae bacterium]
MSAAQWKQISNGLAQCPKALNKFIDDVYKRRKNKAFLQLDFQTVCHQIFQRQSIRRSTSQS